MTNFLFHTEDTLRLAIQEFELLEGMIINALGYEWPLRLFSQLLQSWESRREQAARARAKRQLRA